MTCRYQIFDDLRSHLKKLGCGEYEMRGSWTLAQIYFHLAAAFEGSMEGLPPGYSRIARMIVRPMRSFVTNVRFPPWLPIPRAIRFKLEPPRNAVCSEQLQRLLTAIELFEKHPGPFPPHPVLGAFTKEEWTGFHLRHSEHHLSFVRDKG